LIWRFKVFSILSRENVVGREREREREFCGLLSVQYIIYEGSTIIVLIFSLDRDVKYNFLKYKGKTNN